MAIKYIERNLTPQDKYNIKVLTVTDIEELRRLKIAALSDQCNAAIVVGFYSSALGTQHLYPFDLEAQANLQGAVAAIAIGDNSDVPFKTLDAGYLIHTAEQFKIVALDAKAHLLAQLMKNDQLKAQVNAATTLEELNAITW